MWGVLWLSLLLVTACQANEDGTVLTFSGSALGAEGTLLALQLERFMRENHGIRVRVLRTP